MFACTKEMLYLVYWHCCADPGQVRYGPRGQIGAKGNEIHAPVLASLQQLWTRGPQRKRLWANAVNPRRLPALFSWGAAEPAAVSSSSKPPSSHPPTPDPPSFTGGGENFKGRHRKWKGTLFSRPDCETYQGCASAQNQPGLLDMLKRQSRLETGEEDQTRGEKQRRIRWADATERNGRQIRLGKATFMQVTSHIPFHLFLTTKGEEKNVKKKKSLWNIDDKEKPWSASLKSLC